MACCAARHQSSGSCSAHPAKVERKGACSADSEATTLPDASTRTARVPPVPTSIPRKCKILLRQLGVPAMPLSDTVAYPSSHSDWHGCTRVKGFSTRQEADCFRRYGDGDALFLGSFATAGFPSRALPLYSVYVSIVIKNCSLALSAVFAV